MSLRLRVWLGLGIIAVLVVVSAFTTRALVESSLIEQVDGRLQTAFGGRESRPLTTAPGRPEPSNRPIPQGFRVFFTATITGGVVERSTPVERGTTALPVPKLDIANVTRLSLMPRPEPFTVNAVDRSDLEYRVIARQDRRNGSIIVVAAPLDEVADSLTQLDRIVFGMSFAILVALFAIAWWMIQLGVRPVKRIASTASAIADPSTPFDLSQRVDAAAPGTEVGDLGRAFNTMLDRLELSFDEQRRIEERLRRFVSDASHELRTPVQTIRGYAELYRLGALSEPDRLSDAMRRTEQESLRMAALVDDLLTLARFDDPRPIQLVPIDLSAIARDVAHDALAVQPDRSVSVKAPHPVIVAGDDHQLRQIVSNLVGNASVHTPMDAAIRIEVTSNDTAAVLTVTDDGPGMPDDVAQRAFERFVRADASRSRKFGGSGLGLAIVEAAVHAHGGIVALESAPGHGTTVTISFPLQHTSKPSK